MATDNYYDGSVRFERALFREIITTMQRNK
jgi:hypothetical protein